MFFKYSIYEEMKLQLGFIDTFSLCTAFRKILYFVRRPESLQTHIATYY